MKTLLGILLTISINSPLMACTNASYSQRDEVAITDDLSQLIIGAFAHHGEAFYQNEIKRCLRILDRDPKDFVARNDLGVAYLKLSDWEQAEATFRENGRRYPGRYKTASNLGVMYKKRGEFHKAAWWIERALAIQPGGHMGLGDYYLRMIDWRAAANGRSTHENFLGVRYDAGPKATAEVANRKHVITLIKNDMEFADVYLVLGDILYIEKDYQLAIRAYWRAGSLGSGRAYQRARMVGEKWRLAAKADFEIADDLGREAIYEEFGAARVWLATYQDIEVARITNGKSVRFSKMKSAVAAHGLKKPVLIEEGYYQVKWFGGHRDLGGGRTSTTIAELFDLIIADRFIPLVWICSIFLVYRWFLKPRIRRTGFQLV